MNDKYQKTYEQYLQTAAKARGGDKAAMAEKPKMMNDLRSMERESARAGTVLRPVQQGNQIVVKTKDTSSRRSLREEYVRQFSDETPVEITRRRGVDDDDAETVFKGTLRNYHAKRLLGR